MTPEFFLLPAWTPGWPELLVILFIVLILFGSRIPGLGRKLGSGIREFKEGLSDEEPGQKPEKNGGEKIAEKADVKKNDASDKEDGDSEIDR